MLRRESENRNSEEIKYCSIVYDIVVVVVAVVISVTPVPSVLHRESEIRNSKGITGTIGNTVHALSCYVRGKPKYKKFPIYSFQS